MPAVELILHFDGGREVFSHVTIENSPSLLSYFLSSCSLRRIRGFSTFTPAGLGTNLLERLGCTSLFAPAGPIFGPDLALRICCQRILAEAGGRSRTSWWVDAIASECSRREGQWFVTQGVGSFGTSAWSWVLCILYALFLGITLFAFHSGACDEKRPWEILRHMLLEHLGFSRGWRRDQTMQTEIYIQILCVPPFSCCLGWNIALW